MAFSPPSPLMTYQNMQRPQYQPMASTARPTPMSNPLAGPQAQEQQNPLMAMMAQRGAKNMDARMTGLDNTNAALASAGADPLSFGQRVGGMFGFNNYAGPGGAAAAMRQQEGIPSNMQGPPMPMDMFKQTSGNAQMPQAGADSGFFPGWLTSMFS